MNPAAIIIQEALAGGVNLRLSSTGTIKAIGRNDAINRCLCTIRAHKYELIDELKRTTAAGRSFVWWRLRFPDQSLMEVACSPPATHAEMSDHYPSAIQADPFTPIIQAPINPLTIADAAAIQAWLTSIGETKPALIDQVLIQCRTNADARNYFISQALQNLTHAPIPSPMLEFKPTGEEPWKTEP